MVPDERLSAARKRPAQLSAGSPGGRDREPPPSHIVRRSTTRLCILNWEIQRRSPNPTSMPVQALSSAPGSATVGSWLCVSASSQLKKSQQFRLMFDA